MRTRLLAVRKRYTNRNNDASAAPRGNGVVRRASTYLLSGILVCARCGSPMSIMAGTSAAYCRCSLNRTKGTSDHATSFREDVARAELLGALRERLLSADGLAYVRRRIAEELRDYSKRLETEIKERRERLKRTEDKIRGLIVFIATGDRSEYIASTLRDLEAFTLTEKAENASLVQAAQDPHRLPSPRCGTSIAGLVRRQRSDARSCARSLKDGVIRMDTTADRMGQATGSILPAPLVFGVGRKQERQGGPWRSCVLRTL